MADAKAVKLVYTGPLKGCGFTGPVTNAQYIAHGREPFAVAEEDAAPLLKQHAGYLERHKPPAPANNKRKTQPDSRKREPEPPETESET